MLIGSQFKYITVMHLEIRKAAYQSITEAAPRKRVFSQGMVLYAPSKIVQSRVAREKGVDEAKCLHCMVNYSVSTS